MTTLSPPYPDPVGVESALRTLLEAQVALRAVGFIDLCLQVSKRRIPRTVSSGEECALNARSRIEERSPRRFLHAA